MFSFKTRVTRYNIILLCFVIFRRENTVIKTNNIISPQKYKLFKKKNHETYNATKISVNIIT